MNFDHYTFHSVSGDTPAFHVNISDQTWFLLHKDPKFKDNWHNKEPVDKRRYHLTVSCVTRGLTDRQMLTVMWIWHNKHGLTFTEAEFWGSYRCAGRYAEPKVMKYEANQYWKETRRIAFDNNSRQHSKLRVAYYLMNVPQASARESHEKTGIPLKTVRNCLGALQKSGKVEMVSYGDYRTVESLQWDRACVVETPDGSYVWHQEHPAMYWWGQTINERYVENGVVYMKCYDYCRDASVVVLYDKNQKFSKVFPNPDELEWVVNGAGDVVENGTSLQFISLFSGLKKGDTVTLKNEDEFDFRRCNLVVTRPTPSPVCQDDNVDYYSRLASMVGACA